MAAVRPADGYPWYYEQFLCRRHGRYLCNATGGRRGTIIASIVHGLFISLLPALVAPYLGQIVVEGLPSLAAYTVTDVDCVSMGLFYSWLLKPVLGLFGMAA